MSLWNLANENYVISILGRRPGRRPAGHLKNHRISAEYASYPGAMTRDQVSVPLREEPSPTYSPATYKSDSSILDPIKPMLYNDPYLQVSLKQIFNMNSCLG